MFVPGDGGVCGVNIHEASGALGFDIDISEDSIVTDALILARVTRMSDGQSSFVMCGNDGLDAVVRAGLIECGRQVNDGGWEDLDDDD